MRLRRIARPLARKGLSVIVAFLLSEFPNFRWDLERRVTRLRSQPIVTDQLSRSKHKSADRDHRGDHDVLVQGNPKRHCEVDDRG
jgi:hypothetical protein